jgi:ribosomal protein S18
LSERVEVRKGSAGPYRATAEARGRSRPGFGPRGGDEGRGAGERGGRGRFPPRRRVCYFCVERIEHIDYKLADFLRQYLTDRAKIKARRKSGVCARHQRRLALAIKRARHLALLPLSAEQARST